MVGCSYGGHSPGHFPRAISMTGLVVPRRFHFSANIDGLYRHVLALKQSSVRSAARRLPLQRKRLIRRIVPIICRPMLRRKLRTSVALPNARTRSSSAVRRQPGCRGAQGRLLTIWWMLCDLHLSATVRQATDSSPGAEDFALTDLETHAVYSRHGAIAQGQRIDA